MSVDEQQVQSLMELGLNSYEAKAYLALMGRDSFTAPQVADRSGVPRQRVYDVLNSLVEQGLAIGRPGKRGVKYTAVAPDIALNGLIRREEQRVSRLAFSTGSLVTTLLQEYQAGLEENEPLDYIEVLRGSQSIHQRFSEIQEQAEDEILIFTKPPYATPIDQNESGMKALKRKVVARSVYEFSAFDDPVTTRVISSFSSEGEQVRFVETLPLKLVIVDEAIVIVGMEDPIAGRKELTTLVVENSRMAQFMKIAFETVWASGLTLEQTQRHMAKVQEAQQRAKLRGWNFQTLSS